jgi:hypothetical protein
MGRSRISQAQSVKSTKHLKSAEVYDLEAMKLVRDMILEDPTIGNACFFLDNSTVVGDLLGTISFLESSQYAYIQIGKLA